jgi:hypothetical protein
LLIERGRPDSRTLAAISGLRGVERMAKLAAEVDGQGDRPVHRAEVLVADHDRAVRPRPEAGGKRHAIA